MTLENVNDLQEIVAVNVDAISPGLRLLGTRVALGSATIDLLTVDPAGELTLVALGFSADDQMLLRALEAYSWCLEYPDALGRLYPAERLSPAPPRVVFIAEKLSDAFLRKIRHLRFSRVDCLEFFFGLQFKLVDEFRGTHDSGEARAPQPPPPAPPPRVESPPPRRSEPPLAPPPRPEPPAAPRPEPHHREARRREEPAAKPVAAKVVTPPVAPEPVVAGDQSRALGGSRDARRPGDVDEDMVRVVREYLKGEFPTAVVYDFFVHDRGAQMFQLQDSQGALIHSAAVSGDLLEGGTESSLRAFLDRHRLARVLRESGAAGVLVTKSGLRVEKR
jgi:hypothetical protein